MFNVDGSEGEMCGNGIRCVAKYAWDHGLTRHNPMRVETGRGVLTLALKVVEGKAREVTRQHGRADPRRPRRSRTTIAEAAASIDYPLPTISAATTMRGGASAAWTRG